MFNKDIYNTDVKLSSSTLSWLRQNYKGVYLGSNSNGVGISAPSLEVAKQVMSDGIEYENIINMYRTTYGTEASNEVLKKLANFKKGSGKVKFK